MTSSPVVYGTDGLVARDSGDWAQDKLFFLSRYMNIFSTGMKNRHPRRVYVDLMAGPGLCLERKSGREFPGSPLLAIATPTPFSEVVLVEKEPECRAALEARLARTQTTVPTTLIGGDSNDRTTIADVRARIGTGLGLIFIDLIGLDVWFQSVRAVTAGLKADLVITFPDMDLKRNAPQPDLERWDRFFGSTRWRGTVERWERHVRRDGSVAALLANLYRKELATQLGYVYSTCARPMVNSRRAALYRPMFASRDMKGLEFWRKISSRDRLGQGSLF